MLGIFRAGPESQRNPEGSGDQMASEAKSDL